MTHLPKPEIPELTWLRFAAAFCVLVAHTVHWLCYQYDPIPSIISCIMRLAGIGMPLFFVLSGFVIHYNYNTFFKNTLFKNYPKFIKLRFARLYPLYILCIIVLFLGISFMYRAMGMNVWGKTWLIVVDGILLWVVYLLNLGVKKLTSLRRIFHLFARICLGMEVMVLSVAVFLFVLVIVGYPKSWIILIAGVAAIFIADAVYAAATKRKLRMINYLIYIPAVATMLYIILSAVGVLMWNTGWMLIIFSLVLDFLVMYASFARNRQYKQEVVDTWKEN